MATTVAELEGWRSGWRSAARCEVIVAVRRVALLLLATARLLLIVYCGREGVKMEMSIKT